MTSLITEIISHVWSSKELLSPIFHLCDKIGPRPSGSRAADNAANFIRSKFDDSQLTTSIHEFSHGSWTAEKHFLAIDNQEFPSTPFNLSGNGQLSGECFYLPNPSKEAFEHAHFEGKILLAEAVHGMGMHRTEILKRAVEGGALAYIQISKIPGGIVETGNISTKGVANIPALCISYETGHFLRRKIQQGDGRVTLSVKGSEFEVKGKNVIGNIDSGSDDTIIIGAHYDTWENGPGAFDNGTGIATLLELSKTLSKLQQSGVNFQFIAFSAEELGFKGSMAYKKEVIESNKLQIPIMMNLDCTAYPKGQRTLSVSNSEEDFAIINQLINSYNFNSVLNTRPPFGTDGFPFYLSKIPVVSLEQIDRTKPSFMHTPFDTPEKLTENSLKNSTAIAGAILGTLVQKYQ